MPNFYIPFLDLEDKQDLIAGDDIFADCDNCPHCDECELREYPLCQG